jgi:pyridoxamine 5'-phosphate oxidase
MTSDRRTALRQQFEALGLDPLDVEPDPMRQFAGWYADAVDSGMHLPNAMALATVSADGRPSVRHVLLKELEDDGFVFFTNYESAKAHDLAATPFCSLVFPWHELSRQVRVEGVVDKVSARESDEYFATRPRGSQISAWASPQSSEIDDRQVLEARATEIAEQFSGRDVPRPPFWGGYRCVPAQVEFWQGRPDRLHDRVRYRRLPDDTWRVQLLAP